MAGMVVKFYCDDGEIFRRQLPEPTFEAIVELVNNFRPDVKAHMLHEGRACALKYADDEGDQCVLTSSTFSDFLALQKVDQPLKLQLKLPSTKEGLDHQRLNKESEAKGRGTGCGGKGMKRSKLDISDAPRDVPQDVPIQDSYRTDGLGAAGSVAEGGGLRKFLLSLRVLQESGSVTAERAWIPSLAVIAERRSEQLKDLAKNGLNPTLQTMLAIIQEEAASTPGLERYAAVLAKVLSGEIDQRRLGKALPNMMKALQELETEVQSRFCEGVARSLLPHMEEIGQLPIGCRNKGKGKGKCKGKGNGKEQAKTEERSKLVDVAKQQLVSEGGGLRKFLLNLRTLQEAGSVTAERLASLLVAWIPSLAVIAERRSEQLKDLAENGLNPTLQTMLAIIQEQVASTPGLERYAAVLAKVLSGEIDQRRLGKALPNMMKALQELETEVQSRFCEGVARSLLPHMEEISQLPIGCRNKGKGKGKGKGNGKEQGKTEERSNLDDVAKQQLVSEGGGLRKFLLNLRTLQEAGSVTAERLASLLVAWIPSLAAIAERRSEQLKDLAKNGLNPPLQNMLAVIQEQAAATPHLKRYAAVLAKVLSGEIDQRRLGKALPNMMKALQELETEVQSRFCEGVARSLLPHMEEISQLPIGCRNKGKGKGKCKGKGNGKEQGKTEERSKLDDVAKQQLVSEGGGLRKFLLNLRTLQEAGSVTAERLASLLVVWIPSLARIAERRCEQLKNGLNPPLQNMLAIIQEQAATTPHLKRYAAVLAKVLAGEIDQRRLGKALPNMMKALQGLEPEVQSRFCEGVAHSLLPHMEELSQLSTGCHKQDKGKGKGKEGKQLKRSKLDYGANANQKPFSEGGGLRKFLLRLRALQEAGSMTSETLASMLVAWIPSLARIAERRSEQLKDLAQNGLNPPLQKMLAIIQEQAATTPHLKRYAAVLAKVLAGEIHQRRLGKALPNMMKALQGLEPEVQSRFCEGVARSFVPHTEELQFGGGPKARSRS